MDRSEHHHFWRRTPNRDWRAGIPITVVTKSGTNSNSWLVLFEFHDDQHLKAREFFPAASDRDKPLSIYNNYGGTLGGPIVKNKLFWFFSYDATPRELRRRCDVFASHARHSHGGLQRLPSYQRWGDLHNWLLCNLRPCDG